MGFPTTEISLTPAMPTREDHEVHKGHVVALKKNIYKYTCNSVCFLLAILGRRKKKHNDHYHHHHHQFLSLLVHHRTSMKSSHSLRSPAVPLTSFHDHLVLLISPSIALRHVLFSPPLLLYPWGFQSNAVFSVAPDSLRNVCPIQFHFHLFIWFSIDFWWAILHSSSFVILSVHFIFIIRLQVLIYSAVYSAFGNLRFASHR